MLCEGKPPKVLEYEPVTETIRSEATTQDCPAVLKLLASSVHPELTVVEAAVAQALDVSTDEKRSSFATVVVALFVLRDVTEAPTFPLIWSRGFVVAMPEYSNIAMFTFPVFDDQWKCTVFAPPAMLAA